MICFVMGKALFGPIGEASTLSKQWMSLSRSWITFSKSLGFENFNEGTSLELSKDLWCAKSVSLAASESCFSEISKVGLGGWGEVSGEKW